MQHDDTPKGGNWLEEAAAAVRVMKAEALQPKDAKGAAQAALDYAGANPEAVLTADLLAKNPWNAVTLPVTESALIDPAFSAVLALREQTATEWAGDHSNFCNEARAALDHNAGQLGWESNQQIAERGRMEPEPGKPWPASPEAAEFFTKAADTMRDMEPEALTPRAAPGRAGDLLDQWRDSNKDAFADAQGEARDAAASRENAPEGRGL